MKIKVDSYVVETNIHFPTDLNLTWDCGRKCLDIIDKIQTELGSQGEVLPEWRERESYRSKLKKEYRNASEIHRKKGNNYQPRLKKATEGYLDFCKKIMEKCKSTLGLDLKGLRSIKAVLLLTVLGFYLDLLVKHIDLVDRRILKGEKIPHKEKLFSIFEQHTRWNNKGKANNKVELGLPIVLATDQYQFILHHQVMETQSDVDLTQKVGQVMQEKYVNQNESELVYNLSSISFDRGFYSLLAKEALEGIFDHVVLPKPGKKSLLQEQEESAPVFVVLKKAHSGVEANINCLENHGVNRCPDKGLPGFKRYTALGVLSYNLQQLGKLLIGQKEAEELKAEKKRLKRA